MLLIAFPLSKVAYPIATHLSGANTVEWPVKDGSMHSAGSWLSNKIILTLVKTEKTIHSIIQTKLVLSLWSYAFNSQMPAKLFWLVSGALSTFRRSQYFTELAFFVYIGFNTTRTCRKYRKKLLWSCKTYLALLIFLSGLKTFLQQYTSILSTRLGGNTS